ncbi:MAG: hypothetical protein LQ338_005779 [Usnochroma carphineum]|nr:MAG: hypothetical protein LQ338_005779 [Usnochroma carphineum]
MGQSQRLFAVTISAKRKPGMDEDAYHKYISETHAGHLKHLLVENKIVDYTMVGADPGVTAPSQHNTSELMKDIDTLFPNLSSVNHSPYDAFVTIVFRNMQNYINVKNDPHYMSVVNPDHANFADGPSTMMSFGWFEKHVANGKLVEG